MYNVPRGQLSTILLSTLIDGDKYGVEIISNIKEKTDGNLTIKQPSLYSSLARMEKQGFINSYWRDGDKGGKRHYYSITDLGKKQLGNLENNFFVIQNNVSNNEISTNPSPTNIDLNNIPIEKKQRVETLGVTENTAIKQSSFLNTSTFKIKTNKEKDTASEKQINIFENNADLIKKKFNIENEISNCKPTNLSFAAKIKNLNSLNEVNNKFSKDSNENVLLDSKNNLISDKTNFEENDNIIDNEKNVDITEILTTQNQSSEARININNELPIDIQKDKEMDSQIENVEKKFKPERQSLDDMSNFKKTNFLHLNNNSTIKLNPNALEYGHTEKINELYKKSKKINENQFISSDTPTYNELSDYYKNINVHFSAHSHDKNKQGVKNLNYIDFYKAGLKKYLILFLLIAFETIGCYFAFTYFNLEIAYSNIYFIIPAVSLIMPIYYFILVINSKTKYISDVKINSFWLDLLIFAVGIVLLYSINMLLGLTYANILEYATTFIYPAILLVNILFVYALNSSIYKNIKKYD
ncbi:MAG: helix-turn-helix transcriptional regulator [Clostridia bacterium]|nr:helix-turn-helix transcriptional regulator [Clostridia bacterium]